MTVALPVLVLILAVLACRLRRQNWATCLVIAASFWAAYLVLVSESLSLVRGLQPAWVALSWLVALLAILWILWSSGEWQERIRDLRGGRPRLRDPLVVLAFPLAFLSALLLLIALLSPPNTTDSLRYHMPRVLHWVQNASLAHYPTSYQPQLWNPPFAEMVMMHLRLLWDSDRLVNLVQWASMAGSLVVVAGIARLMGASRLGRAAAVAFAFSIPMGLLQATSTQTDYVTAFWLVCAAYLIVKSRQQSLSRLELVSLGFVIGLGMLSKVTFYIYVVPFAIWYGVVLLKEAGLRRTFATGIWVAAPALLINSWYWSRNIRVFGGLFGSADWLQTNTNFGGSAFVGGAYLSSLFKSIAANFATPSEIANYEFWEFVIKLDRVLGVDSSGYRFLWGWNHEDIAGSPLHFGLVALTVVLLVVFRPWRAAVWQYAVATLTGFLLLSIFVAFDPFRVRFQLPFLVAWAPLFGLSVAAMRARWPAIAATALLLLASIPWILFNTTRPLIGLQPDPKGLELPCVFGCTAVGSVLQVPEQDLLFANWRSLAAPVGAIAQLIEQQGCQQVGIRIDSLDMEYPFWSLLGAPNSGIRIETIYTFPHLESLKDPEFKPCAIVCTICGDRTKIHGLDLVHSEGGISVYGGTSYSPEFEE